MATEGGEQRKGDAVPAPVPAASFFVDLCAWQEFPVGLFACFHVTVSALVALAIAAAMLNKGGACHHIGQSQDYALALMARLTLIIGVEWLAGMLASSRAFTGWCSEQLISFFLPLMVIVSVKVSVRLLYAVLFGCFGGDIVKVAVTVAVVVVAQLALSFWGAKVMVKGLVDAGRADGHEQSRPGSTSAHGDSSDIV